MGREVPGAGKRENVCRIGAVVVQWGKFDGKRNGE